MKRNNKQTTGQKAHADGYKAENFAALFLRLKGYRILERNFKPPRGTGAGEIDIIAMKGKTLVFIEVKYRSDTETAAESVSAYVQERRIKGAEYYLMKHPEAAENEMRFDVVLIAPKQMPQHIQNAFICS